MHPGSVVRQECLEKHGLSVTEAARVLGVDRQTLSNLLNARSGISPEMAIRLEKAFGLPAREWLIRQLDHELAEAMQKAEGIDVQPLAGTPDDRQGAHERG
ncbi:HigA family addiction module antidote protein [Aurantimonas aggregata]|uniref:HigA family addiction module antidote protein n=1 Tax=Aurantimonas aggregata TaxID=2047720 RepID=A0A6L9MMM6_9HYPH|nr:HigA family addiction module antitoxin [Aurantimonas aggregata]NDV89073.1 HigA family addiction module antidote protein [Aurantimonas aggregata]